LIRELASDTDGVMSWLAAVLIHSYPSGQRGIAVLDRKCILVAPRLSGVVHERVWSKRSEASSYYVWFHSGRRMLENELVCSSLDFPESSALGAKGGWKCLLLYCGLNCAGKKECLLCHSHMRTVVHMIW